MFCHLDSKSHGAFNFVGTFALKIVQKHPQPHFKKRRNMLRHKPDGKDAEIRTHK